MITTLTFRYKGVQQFHRLANISETIQPKGKINLSYIKTVAGEMPGEVQE